MPVYVYRCEECGSQLEKRQSFSDQPLTVCESCHGRVHRVLQPAAIVFKGSGFYSTDHRSSSGTASNGTNGQSNGSDTDKSNGESSKAAGEPSKSSGESSTTAATIPAKKESGKSAAAAAKD